jgi:hypothetical protein
LLLAQLNVSYFYQKYTFVCTILFERFKIIKNFIILLKKKIRLWYKHQNDDNFKISLSQIFLQPSSRSYFKTKTKTNNKSSATLNPNILNLEDELCELLHENNQLKNFLKEVYQLTT